MSKDSLIVKADFRMVAARMKAGFTQLPDSGARRVTAFRFQSPTGTIYTKRIIGVPGDRVARGPSNTILVNDVQVAFPTPCGEHESFDRLAAEGPAFDTIEVPEGSLFVVGDNLDNSYDSRFFGVVPLDEVRGKPKFIYWSHNRSRIGCNLR